MKLTKAQQGQFWRMFGQASSYLHLGPSEGEAYRHRVLREEAGVEHLADLGRTGDFDKVMARLAVDACDYEQACRYAAGDVKRFRHMVLARARELIEVKGESVCSEDYVAGILFQGRLVYRPHDTPASYGQKLLDPSAWEDIPAHTLRLVLQILTVDLLRARRGAK